MDIKVLWIDDQNFEQLENNAAAQGIDITHVFSWADAVPLLQGWKFDEWSAIIFDCYCASYPGGPEDHLFLRKAFAELDNIRGRRIIPWYILSGGQHEDFDMILNYGVEGKERLLWDAGWEKVFYSKNIREDIKALLSNIKTMSQYLPNYKVKYRFKDVFSFLELDEVFDHQLQEIMFPVLKNIIYPEESSSFIAKLYYNPLRQAIEYLFRSCHRFGFLPDDFITTPHGVNLRYCSLLLSGDSAGEPGKQFRYTERVFPSVVSNAIKSILNIANVQSHTTDLTEDDKRKVDEFLSITGAEYFVYSMALNLCSVFVWYRQYLLLHLEKNVNKDKIKYLQGSKDKEEIILPIEIDEEGVAHCGPYALRTNSTTNLKGLKVRIVSIKPNLQETKDKYPQTARFEKLE